MFRTNNFDKLLEKATSSLRLDPDWPSILQICDLIRQNDCTPKYAVVAIKKKLSSPNPHQAMFALLVLESIVKNCGAGVHDEIASISNCESYRALVKSQTHENVRTKLLELMQAWAYAFRNIPKYRTVQDAVNILKAEGYKFPTLKESDAMFSADSAPEWSDGDVCHRCRVPFSLMQRKHHCRACGQVFCQQCSAKTTTLPKFGIEKEVRVCDACLDQVNKPTALPGTPAKTDTVDLSSNYVASTLVQENQAPKGKTAEELREEEDIQLALALSQSEAEQKEKEKRTSVIHSSPVATQMHQSHGSPPSSAPPAELSRYLDRNYWEQRVQPEPPSAPTSSPGPTPPLGVTEILTTKLNSLKLENGGSSDPEMEEFVTSLKSQVEIFVNRMKSNSSRGRSIANDSSVQTLFMNITAMHSRLLRYIQQHDDSRVYYEGLQDKLTQVKDSRAALDVLREEHAERMRRAAEQAELQRQLQMAHKLDVMRKKKQEYLQYQRQLALQRVQEQEREMQMRQEQQKHQYMLGGAPPFYMQGSPVHQFHGVQQSQPPYNQGYPSMMSGLHQQSQMLSDNPNIMKQGSAPAPQTNQLPQVNMPIQQGQHMSHIPQLNVQMGGIPQTQQIGQGVQMNQIPALNQLPSNSLRHPTPLINQMPHNQHSTQPQGPQLPHQTSLNKPLQVGMPVAQPPQHVPQGQPQIGLQGPQQLQQAHHMGPQGPPITQLGQMQQIQHGQMPGSHPVSQISQQNQPPGQIIPQASQNIGPQTPQAHQLQAKGMPVIYMDSQMNPQMTQMMQMGQGPHIPHMNPQMNGPLPVVGQNITPGHHSQLVHGANQMPPTGQVIGQQMPQMGQNINQNSIPPNNPIINPDVKLTEENQSKMSPSRGVPINSQSSEPLESSQNSIPRKVDSIEESVTTAELISFD